jgi:glycosyltransferase involved in cell wall biosynthesis
MEKSNNSKKPSISIVIPAHNEEKRIGPTLESYGKFFNDLKNKNSLDYEIIIVINNTKDKTLEIVKKAAAKNKNISYLNFKQGGKGFAIIEGFKKALKSNKSLIGFVDADASTSPEAYYDLIKNIDSYDAIIASRYVSGAKVNPKQSLRRIFVSRVFNLLVRTLFIMPYKDTQCGAKILTREATEKVVGQIGITQWAFDIDLIYRLRKNKLSIKEQATVWSDKERSTLNLKRASIQMFLAIVRLRIINSPLKPFLKIIRPLVAKVWRRLQ